MDNWKIYGLTVVILFVKMFAAVLVQGYGRYKHRGFANPEDAVMFDKLFGSKPDTTKQSELVDRAQSVLRNDGENIPIFLFIAMTYIQLGCWQTGVAIYLPLFVIGRIAHTISYLTAIQPWRNLSYQLGIWTTFVMAGHIVWQSILTSN
ncbi:MAG: MAPEG family protein [Waterburya sp.]